MLHILLLLTQEVEAHSIQCIGTELVFPQQHLGGLGWGRASELWGGAWRLWHIGGGRSLGLRLSGFLHTCSMSI